jgi:GT2 family glycosyltransferase/glycosyltransferase involved in cell wall biosynthesis
MFDIVVPVYNSMHHVRDCLESVFRNSSLPFHLYVVDDCSDAYSREQLEILLNEHDESLWTLITNWTNQGYLKSCNTAIEKGSNPYVILLNSDAIVQEGYLEKVERTFIKDPSIGVINPVSNWANWTRIPFPSGYNMGELANEVEHLSTKQIPDIKNASGFFFAVPRKIYDELGVFDEDYGRGYYEETDFCMRVLEANYRVVVDDSLYVFHHGWGSFQEEGRNENMDRNKKIFMRRWGDTYTQLETEWRAHNPIDYLTEVLDYDSLWKEKDGFSNDSEGIISAEEAKTLLEEIESSKSGLNRVLRETTRHPKRSSDKIIYVLPAIALYGGVVSVLQLVNRLVSEGIDANVVTYGPVDEQVYRMFPLYFRPYVFESKESMLEHFPKCGLIVATSWETVYPTMILKQLRPEIELAYFVQDFEPDFYGSERSELRALAEKTYSLIPRQIVKSQWLKNKLLEYGGDISLIPLGLNLDFFHDQGKPRTVDIIGMARPTSARRNFPMLKEIFEEIHTIRPDIKLGLYGRDYDTGRLNFPVTDFGEIKTMSEMAKVLNQAQILLDCSTFQGFGRPGLEAMACGTVGVLTHAGGIVEYAKHEYNCFLADPYNKEDMVRKLITLVDDDRTRKRFIENGYKTSQKYSHILEGKSTYNVFQQYLS